MEEMYMFIEERFISIGSGADMATGRKDMEN
jgi:hypothetical protein